MRNIDSRTVTQADLLTLFSKSGPVISASFDKNLFGQGLGSATLVYSTASSAARCIKTYNGAQLDDKVMKIEYANPQVTVIPQVKNVGKSLQIQKPKANMPGIRKGTKTIGRNRSGGGNQGANKKKGGKTLNLMGSTQNGQRRRRLNSDDAGAGNTRGGNSNRRPRSRRGGRN